MGVSDPLSLELTAAKPAYVWRIRCWLCSEIIQTVYIHILSFTWHDRYNYNELQSNITPMPPQREGGGGEWVAYFEGFDILLEVYQPVR